MIPNEVYCSECPEWSETVCSKGFVDIEDCAYMDKEAFKFSEERWDKVNEETYEYDAEKVFEDDVGEEE